MIFSTLITILAASSVSGYSLCNTANYPYAGKTISIPILKSSTSKGANGETVTVSGTVNIVDGCKFTLKDFSFSGVATISVYGGMGSDAAAVKLISDSIPSSKSPITQTYTFISTSGNWVSYNDFTQFRFFEESTGLIVGSASIPNAVVPAASSTASSVISSTAAAASPAATLPTAASPTAASPTTGSNPAPAPAAAAAKSAGTQMGLSAALTAPLAFILVVASALM